MTRRIVVTDPADPPVDGESLVYEADSDTWLSGNPVASAISIADAGNDFTATDVEGALAELQADAETAAAALTAHNVSSDAHPGHFVGPLLISDDHSTPIVFADLLLTEEGDDLLYADIGG